MMTDKPRRRVLISSDEEDEGTVRQTNQTYVIEDEENINEGKTFVVEETYVLSPEARKCNSSQEKSYLSSIAASTPRLSPRNSNKFMEISSVSSYEDIDEHDRSRSFIEGHFDDGEMSPISTKLKNKSDTASKQKLRERLLKKSMQKERKRANMKLNLDDDFYPTYSSAVGDSNTSHMSVGDESFEEDKRVGNELKTKSNFERTPKKNSHGSSSDGWSQNSTKSRDSLRTTKDSNVVICIDSDSDDSFIKDDSKAVKRLQTERVVSEVDIEEIDDQSERSSNGSSEANNPYDERASIVEESDDEEFASNQSILLSSGSVNDDTNDVIEKSESIVYLSSDDEAQERCLSRKSNKENREAPVAAPKSLPSHLSKYSNDNLSELQAKKEKMEQMLARSDSFKLKDGGESIRQTLRNIEEAIVFKKNAGSDNTCSIKSQKPEVNQTTVHHQQRPLIIPPPQFDPAAYSRQLAHDKKRLFGGKMNDDRWERIQSVTERALKGMHNAMNNMPDETFLIETPNGLKVELMHHQKQSLAWMAWRETQAVPADDMGLGKTLSTIALIVHQKNERLKRKDEGKDEDDKNRREVAKQMGLIPSNATLVVAPASVIFQWEAEIERRVKPDKLSVHVFHGPKNRRLDDPKRLARYDIVITTYNLLATELTEKITTKNKMDDVSDLEENENNWGEPAGVDKGKKNIKRMMNTDSVLAKVAFERIILDEAHQIKNKNTSASKSACRIAAQSHWCLSGTPIHNNLWDLFSLVRFMRVSPFDDETHWKEYIMGSSQKCADRLNILTKSLLLRRTKAQTCSLTNKPLVDLKPKIIKQHDLILEGLEGEIYDIMFRATQLKAQQIISEAEAEKREKLYGYQRKVKGAPTEQMRNPFNFGPRQINAKDKFSAMTSMLVMLLRLRQACVHMHLTKQAVDMDAFEHLGGDEQNANDLLERTMAELTLSEDKLKLSSVSTAEQIFEKDFMSSKLRRVMEIVDEVLRLGDKIVIVSQWTSLLSIVEEHVKSRGARCTSINGSIQPADRQSRVDSFNQVNGGARIMLLSLTAGGVGLNLVGGNHLIMVDLHWNPALEAQACDRIYRMGQQKTVYIHRLVAAGTIESRVLDLQEKKLQLAGQVLEGAASKKMNKLTMQDLKFLFELDKKGVDSSHSKAKNVAPIQD